MATIGGYCAVRRVAKSAVLCSVFTGAVSFQAACAAEAASTDADAPIRTFRFSRSEAPASNPAIPPAPPPVPPPSAASLTAYTTVSRSRAPDLKAALADDPSIAIGGASINRPVLVVRGASDSNTDSTADVRIGLYQDGAAIVRLPAALTALYDLDKLEVVKGASAAALGADALAGAINIVTQKASPAAFDGRLHVSGGSLGFAQVDGFINAPLTQHLAVRISGFADRRDGYVSNLLGGAPLEGYGRTAGRVSLNSVPLSNVSNDLSFSYERYTGTGSGAKSTLLAPVNPATGQIVGNLNPYSATAVATSPALETGRPLGQRRFVATAVNSLAVKLTPHLTFLSISGYSHFNSLEIANVGGTALPFASSALGDRGVRGSQDFRLVYTGGHGLSITAGASVQGGDVRTHRPNLIDEPLIAGLLSARGIIAPISLAALQVQHFEEFTTFSQNLNYGAYTRAILPLTSKWSVSAGARAGGDSKLSRYSALVGASSATGAALLAPSGTAYAGSLYGLFVQPTIGNGLIDRASIKDATASGWLRSDYRLRPDLSVFASIAQGQNPTTLTANSPAAPFGPAQFIALRPERLVSLEAGATARLFSDHLTVDGRLFDNRHDHYQSDLAGALMAITRDVGQMSASGFEGDAHWRLGRTSELNLGYTHTDAKFGDGLLRGLTPRLTPKDALSFSADIHVPAPGGAVTLKPSATWRAKQYFSDDNGKGAILNAVTGLGLAQDYLDVDKAHTLANFEVLYTPKRGRWTASLFVENLGDTHYLKDAGGLGAALGLPATVRAEPQLIGVNLTLH